MQPCNACRELVGKPSSAPPHGDLAASGVSAIGPPGRMRKISSNWDCTVCGAGYTKIPLMAPLLTSG